MHFKTQRWHYLLQNKRHRRKRAEKKYAGELEMLVFLLGKSSITNETSVMFLKLIDGFVCKQHLNTYIENAVYKTITIVIN